MDNDELYDEYREDQDALNDSDDFEELYGFTHDCHCAEDWEEGNLGIVSTCYLDMTKDALDTLKEMNEACKNMKATITQQRISLAESNADAGV
jgi:hypothetical protein